MPRTVRLLLAAGVMLWVLAACADPDRPGADRSGSTATPSEPASSSDPPPAPSATTGDPAPTPWPEPFADGTTRQWHVRVVDTVPHDPDAFTEGLEVADGVVLESTGGRGLSTVRRVDPTTGDVLASAVLPPDRFGEGLTVVDDRVVQLTWTSGRAMWWQLDSLAPAGEATYEGEGWGLCFDGRELWMSNGSATLTRRDPESFAALGTVEVVDDNGPVSALNELECIGDVVVANVWKSDRIVVISPTDGRVVAAIDASALRATVSPTDPEAVLNGIADRGDGTLLLAGKWWPTAFVVELAVE
ncbi:MAG: glutaminyl-peptide cyclotransferase [Acidimicrobiales bacterium]